MKIEVFPEIHIANNRSNAIGININYLMDADANRQGIPLTDALRDMGVTRLRYPGGEKSDWHFFASPSYEKPQPKAIGFYAEWLEKMQPLDFDAYMDTTRALGIQPHVVVSYDSFERTGVKMETYLEHAAAWVQYANIHKGYNITYWEVGNENWHNNTGTPEELAEVVKTFSHAMKAIDPNIKICASGCRSRDWWSRFLPTAAPYIDCLTVSQYSCFNWGSYNYYEQKQKIDLISEAHAAIEAIDKYVPDHAKRLEVVIVELNSMDYGENPWPACNNLGHSIVTFDLFGQLLTEDRISYGMLWNTRWLKQEEQHDWLWYALDEANCPLPAGLAVKLWGNHIRDTFIKATAQYPLQAYACMDEEGITVFVINKGGSALQAELLIHGHDKPVKSAFVYSGNGPDDLKPSIAQLSLPEQSALQFAPYSITVIIL